MQKTSVSCCTQFRMNTDVLGSYFWYLHWLLVFHLVINLSFSIKESISSNLIVLYCIYLVLWMLLRIYKSTLLCCSGLKYTAVKILHILNSVYVCFMYVYLFKKQMVEHFLLFIFNICFDSSVVILSEL